MKLEGERVKSKLEYKKGTLEDGALFVWGHEAAPSVQLITQEQCTGRATKPRGHTVLTIEIESPHSPLSNAPHQKH